MTIMPSKYILLQKNISDISADLALLDKVERKRYDRLLDDAKKAEFLAGRSFLKQELADMAHVTPEDIELTLSTDGKPSFQLGESDNYRMSYPHFSISHSEGVVVLAFAKFPVGVDLESGKNHSLDSLKPIFTEEEYSVLEQMSLIDQQMELVRLFTMKEAFIKATDKKWGLDQISFEWRVNAWKLHSPSVNCEFYLHESEDSQISVCLFSGE